MRYRQITPDIFLDKEDTELVKIALKRQAGMGIGRARTLYNVLDENKVINLKSRATGYWISTKNSTDEYFNNTHGIMCSSCGNLIENRGWDTVEDFAELVLEKKLPKFCACCGAENKVAFKPSEYLSYFSLLYREEENEKVIYRQYLKCNLESITDIFVDLDDLEGYESRLGEGNYPLFDQKGGLAYA